MEELAGDAGAPDEIEIVKQNCADALAQLQQKRTTRGHYLAHNAVKAIQQCSKIKLLDGLQYQSAISCGYVDAGMFQQAAELDAEIGQSIQRLDNAEERKALEEEMLLRRKKYKTSLNLVDSQSSTTRTARYRSSSHKDSAYASEDRRFRTDYTQRNNENAEKNAGMLPNQDDASSISSSSRWRSLSPKTRSVLPVPQQKSRSRPVTATYESMAQMDSLAPTSETGHYNPDSQAVAFLPINRDVLVSKQAGAEWMHFANSNLDTPDSKADNWFKLLYNTHQFIRGPDDRFQNEIYERIRVAVLDTGFYNTTKEIRDLTQSFSGKIMRTKTFVAGDNHNGRDIDDDGHGTDVLYQLSRVCPNARFYSYRVAQRNEDGTLEANANAVLAALKQAIQDKINVINMSFGWPHDNQDVENALRDAQDAGILLFASVSNFGALGNRNILYPASSVYVTAVDGADGLGEPATFNSSTLGSIIKPRFSAPAVSVLGVVHTRISGTSYSSPIAAGIAALVLEFARQTPLAGDNTIKFLRKREGMELVLRMMHVQKTMAPFMFLTPWKLLCDSSGKAGGNGGPSSYRAHVAWNIVDELRKRYGNDQGIGDKLGDD